MAAVNEKSVGPDCLPGSNESLLATQRVTAYLQGLGLPLENAIGWAQEIVRDVHRGNCREENECADAVGGCSRRAMDRAMSRVDEWLGAIVASRPDPGDDLAAQLQWHLRPVLQRHPESFLRTHDLPDDLHQAIREAARPILPPAIPAVMPAQSFGDLPHLWQRVVAYGGLVRYRLVNVLWRIWR